MNIKIVQIFLAGFLISLAGQLCAGDDANSYMHPDELMVLVHGPLTGNALWLWDTCVVRHRYFTALCILTVLGYTAYEVSDVVRAKVDEVLKLLLNKLQQNQKIQSKTENKQEK